MKKVKIWYSCPYAEERGKIGYVMGTESKVYPGVYLISQRQYRQAERRLPVGGVAPKFDKEVGVVHGDGWAVCGCFGWYDVR